MALSRGLLSKYFIRLFSVGRTLSSAKIDPATYPSARRDETVVDNYHGIKVADPYRWMEDPDAEETKKFVEQLNKVSMPFIQAASSRDAMREKLTEMWDYEKFGCTSKRGDYYYYLHNSGLQNQHVLYQQKSLADKGKVFLDLNSLNSEGTTALTMTDFSKDGSLFAYGLSEKGSDWATIRFKTAEGVDLPDVITGVKHSLLTWIGDNSGVFYCKYPGHAGSTEGTDTLKHEFHSMYFHKLGTDCKDDVLVYERRDDPDLLIGGSVTEDGRFLMISVVRGADPHNALYFYDLVAAGNKIAGIIDPVPLCGDFEAIYDYIDHDDNSVLLQTNKNAPMYKLIRIDLKDHSKVSEVVAEHPKNTMNWSAPLPGNRLLVAYLEDVKSTMYVHDMTSGKRLYQVPLPIGSVTGLFARKSVDEVFYQFESFLVPGITYRMDFSGVEDDEIPKIEEMNRVLLPGLDESQFKVEQLFYESKDKTRVPMFVVSNKDCPLDGSNPTILDGYGGFNVANVPYFSISNLLFVKHLGGIFASTNLRGGSEYGESWHIAGKRENKQNVFDDMHAAAEFLIEKKFTSAPKLAIHGGSNGGLLMGACSQQRPNLFGAVINRVGVLDMLRFHKFTIGAAWVPEYGNPDVPEDFQFIYKYSPLHNIRMPSNGQWPSTLLMTADHDDRVVPSHTLKYAATLIEAAKKHPLQENPLLARIEVEAGHGSGKPTNKVIEETVDMYSFLQRVLDIPWRK